MPKQIARVGDSWNGMCTNHSGPPIPVSGNIASSPQDFSFDEGRLIAVETASCPASCGHVANLIASSILTRINGMKVGLIGDQVIGAGIQGNVVSASTLTNSD
jgi:uncharacterized Zn-binding protein involved in type VI secretion